MKKLIVCLSILIFNCSFAAELFLENENYYVSDCAPMKSLDKKVPKGAILPVPMFNMIEQADSIQLTLEKNAIVLKGDAQANYSEIKIPLVSYIDHINFQEDADAEIEVKKVKYKVKKVEAEEKTLEITYNRKVNSLLNRHTDIYKIKFTQLSEDKVHLFARIYFRNSWTYGLDRKSTEISCNLTR